MASGKNYPKLDLANNSYWLTKRGEVVGPFEETKFYTTKKLPVFKCKTTKALYDVYGVEVRYVFEEYVSYKRLKLTTIDKIAPLNIQQAIGRTNRQPGDAGTGKSGIIIDLMTGKEVDADKLGIPIHEIIESITSGNFSGFVGKTGTPDLSIFSKGINNPNIKVLNDDEYKLKLRKIEKDIFHIDYDYLDTLCDCQECQVAKQTLKNGIATNVVQSIEKLYNYITKILFVDTDTFVPQPDFTRLPVTFHHLYLLHLQEIFMDQTDTTQSELDEVLSDYDPGEYINLMPDGERADLFLRSYHFVSKQYERFMYDNSSTVLAERLQLIAEVLKELNNDKKVQVRFNVDWMVTATRLTMVEQFLNSFVSTSPEFDETLKITVTFDFASDEFNQPSYAVINRRPSNKMFEQYFTDFWILKNSLQSGKEQPKKKVYIKDFLETEMFTEFNIDKLQSFNLLDINGINNLDYAKSNIKAYLELYGIKTFRWPDATQAKAHLQRKLFIMIAERIQNIIGGKNIGLSIAFNVANFMNANIWFDLKINELGKIILFLDQLNYNVLKNQHTIGAKNYVLVFNFDFHHSVMVKNDTLENVRHYSSMLEEFTISIFNRIVKPIKPSKLENLYNLFNQIAHFKGYRSPSPHSKPTAWDTIFVKNDDRLKSIAAKKKSGFNYNSAKAIKFLKPTKKFDTESFTLKGRTIFALGNVTEDDIKNNTELQEIVEAIGDTKKPVTNDLVLLARDWFANPANKPKQDEIEFPNWLVIVMNDLDFSRFIGYKQFKEFYYCLLNHLPTALVINDVRYYPQQTSEILHSILKLINNQNLIFDLNVVKKLNHTTITIRPSSLNK